MGVRPFGGTAHALLDGTRLERGMRSVADWLRLQACFVGGTPLLGVDGSKGIEQFRSYEEWGDGCDRVVSRSEHDVDGVLTVRCVLRTFRRTGWVFNLKLPGGIVIRTTGEHPFFVEGRGWVPARELAAGGQVWTEAGLWAEIDRVVDGGAYVPVFNVCVADFHTYFVGCDEWGFSVWAHNANYGLRVGELERLGAEYAAAVNARAVIARGANSTVPVEVTLSGSGWKAIEAARPGKAKGLSAADRHAIREHARTTDGLLADGVTIKRPSPGGRNGNQPHIDDVAANNSQQTGQLVPRTVGGRVADGVGQPGQVVVIRGVTIDPGPTGRVIVEVEPFSGRIPEAGGRIQIRDMRRGDRGATIVVTDPLDTARPPLVYPPGFQPPPGGHYRGGRTHVRAATE